MSAALDRWLTRLYRAVGATLFLALCGFLAYAAGDRRRPCRVRPAVLVTAEVAPGGTVRQTRVIAYDADCPLRVLRRLRSLGPDGRRVMPPEIALDGPPRDRDGRPRTTETDIPADLPCGMAMPVDVPSAACDWLQRRVHRQHRPDVATPFTVACGR